MRATEAEDSAIDSDPATSTTGDSSVQRTGAVALGPKQSQAAQGSHLSSPAHSGNCFPLLATKTGVKLSSGDFPIPSEISLPLSKINCCSLWKETTKPAAVKRKAIAASLSRLTRGEDNYQRT
ncbi:uncharacterized protein LOC116248933 [Nymphaea colorata]|uniref:uncharacterized protein LOC116248933 n=1 Tax=Nymphaea colorata TaxID=210225 RepID=UPI00129D8865|nr:uncharacterized protein LOC116248933 [Nymphaea colorata]